jgi:hypothetical protein
MGFSGYRGRAPDKNHGNHIEILFFLKLPLPTRRNIAEQSPCEKAQQCGYPAWTLRRLPAFYALKLRHESPSVLNIGFLHLFI